MARMKSAHERFQEKIIRTSACWEWIGAKDHNGHGSFWLDGRQTGAHRAAWFFETGSLPADALLHICDNRACVRPSHLREGSQADNLADMKAKGRKCVGEHMPNAILTADAVRAIRSRHAAGERQSELARAFGVHRTTIRDVLLGRRWSHVEAVA